MNLDRVPSRSEVMGWSPLQLADYLKAIDLFGCDKAVLKNSISGSRFVNLSENDLQKFPKLHMPMISKISSEISKKEKRGPFGKKTTPKYHEPEVPVEVQGWGDDEFDDEELDDDYESPYSGDDDGSGGDYESPNEDLDAANDYEPPPSEPLEEHKLCPTRPLADGEYIDNRNNQASSRGPPPMVNPRPPSSTHLSVRQPAESKRDPSPHNVGPSAGKFPPQPPQIFRSSKPGRVSGPIPTPSGGLHRDSGERPSTRSWKPPVSAPDPSTRPKVPVLPLPSAAVSRSNSSARPQPTRCDGRREQTQDEGYKHNTFPLHNTSASPRPGLHGPHLRHGESLPPGIPPGGSLPHKLHPAMHESRGLDRNSLRPRPPPTCGNSRELDPRWYVGKRSRSQAEGCLRSVHKDGAYLVRDSTRQLASQPFTLMVLYQDKVYNIQIRQQNQQFLLGTGLKVQESFRSVAEIIGHYSKSPLVLIDAKNRSSSQQNQCLLSDPAGHYMTGQK